MKRLARNDPDPARRQRLDGLRVTRGLMLPPAQNGTLLWQAHHTGRSAGFFLAGALRAERQGQPAAARLWLAMDLFERGDRECAQALMNVSGTTLTLSQPTLMSDPAVWEKTPLVQALKDNLGLKQMAD